MKEEMWNILIIFHGRTDGNILKILERKGIFFQESTDLNQEIRSLFLN